MYDDEPTPTRPHVRRRERRSAFALVFLHWRWLDGLHRFALALCLAIGIAAVTTIPDFGWLDVTQVLVAVAVTRVVARAVEDDPHPLPFLDGTLLAAAGFWCAAVTTINALAGAVLNTQALIFGCSALLAFCGLRLRAIERAGWVWD